MTYIKKKIPAYLQAAIDAYDGKVTVVQPAAATGNEQSRATRELVAKRRAEFRSKRKGAKA